MLLHPRPLRLGQRYLRWGSLLGRGRGHVGAARPDAKQQRYGKDHHPDGKKVGHAPHAVEAGMGLPAGDVHGVLRVNRSHNLRVNAAISILARLRSRE